MPTFSNNRFTGRSVLVVALSVFGIFSSADGAALAPGFANNYIDMLGFAETYGDMLARRTRAEPYIPTAEQTNAALRILGLEADSMPSLTDITRKYRSLLNAYRMHPDKVRRLMADLELDETDYEKTKQNLHKISQALNNALEILRPPRVFTHDD